MKYTPEQQLKALKYYLRVRAVDYIEQDAILCMDEFFQFSKEPSIDEAIDNLCSEYFREHLD